MNNQVNNNALIEVEPLESTPEIFNHIISTKLGANINIVKFFDIYSLTEPDLLNFMPRPCTGIILLFPINSTKKIMSTGEKTVSTGNNYYFFKQTIKNACGYHAILHLMANLKTENLEMIFGDNNNLNYNKFKSFLISYKKIVNSGGDNEHLLTNLINNYILNDLLLTTTLDTTITATENIQVDHHYISILKTDDNKIIEFDGRNDKPSVILSNCGEDKDLFDYSSIINNRLQELLIKKTDNTKDSSPPITCNLLGLGPAWD
ncbi:uncharacterized protein SCODWIG_01711 [Saccharomycodes ludwigii]|uniref:Ubiquitin carboxyl-terminal hydrolase n=1 Tax=Saccharomycodes ludwigii TaxID=36035 RepID=A0A376B769_9ASCO|nr:hypothetical protein SCDLUD_000091 [Saccharomycodes ludwigii]KAH3902514.1 hypothetical protein SCDLUD_000091 [Saccharomycodes ludwigii]SSD59950.1 uncharacterized protein SCODWIG_01711 [Saccharomycodes ludwigii]